MGSIATTVSTEDIYGGSHWAAAIAWLDTDAGEQGPTHGPSDDLDGADCWQDIVHPATAARLLRDHDRQSARYRRRNDPGHMPARESTGTQVSGADNLRFLRPVVDPRAARTNVPMSERPGRGNVTVRQGPTGLLPCRNVARADVAAACPVVAVLAPDLSPVTDAGKSSKRSATAKRAHATKANARSMRVAAMAAKLAGPVPIMDNGVVIGWQ